MADEKTTAPTAMSPVAVTVIDTGGHGAQTLQTGTVAETPSAATPNLKLTVIGPAMAIFVRFVNVFLTTLVGAITAGMTTNIIPATDFFQLMWKCAILAVAPASLDLLKNIITIFGRLESKYPLLTGSV